MKIEELTPVCQKRIEAISKKHGKTVDFLMVEFMKLYNEESLATAPTDVIRQDWSSKLLYTNWYNRPRLQTRSIVPVGKGTIRKFKGAEATQRLYVYDYSTQTMSAITVVEDALSMLEDIAFGEFYPDVQIGITEFDTLQIDERTKLPDPVEVFGTENSPENFDDLMINYLKASVITMDDLRNKRNWSKKRKYVGQGGVERESVVDTDWKIIRGCVVSGIREHDQGNGMKRYRLTFSDGNVYGEETLTDGTVLPTQMSGWTDKQFKFSKGTYCDLYGPVELAKYEQKNRQTGKQEKVSRFQMDIMYANPIGEMPEDLA